MSVHFTTATVPGHERFEAWMHATSLVFAPLGSQPPADREFWATAHGERLGAVELTRLSAAGHTVMRTPRLIAAGDPEVFWVSFQIAGTSILSLGERRAVLRSGDMVLYDSSHPYSIVSPAAFKMAVFQFPRSLLRFSDALMADLTGTGISSAEGGAAALVAPFLRGLAAGVADGTLPERRDELGDAVIDLLNAVYAPRVQTDHPPPHAGAAATLARVKAFIDEHLAECDLTPGAIARANHISPRYLYKLFEDEDVGVAEWIRRQRLDRCRRDLRDPALASCPIARIALAWGFRNAEHFSRAFRAAYGLSPGAYRALSANPS